MAVAGRKRIMFVDDEPAILASLQNLLFRDRKRWDLVFASCGEQALAELRKAPFDVVVSDMRMPGMDGAALLTRIKEDHPGTVRIMLSGHAEREAIVRALPALHQLLSKPCDAATLRSVLERSVALASLSASDAVKSIVGKLDKLPSPPTLFHDIARVLESPTAMLRDVAQIVTRDPAMCAKVLQLVNSSYFSTGHVTSSIEQAVAYLGTERLRYILLTAGVFSPLERDPFPGFSIGQLQQTALHCARSCERMVGKVNGQRAFVAALLHDIGQIVLAIGMPAAYRDVAIRSGGLPRCDIEREVLGVTHAEVGACLLEIWGVPRDIVEIVKAHHEPASAPDDLRELACAVHVADALLDAHAHLDQLDAAAIERCGYGAQLAAWRACAEEDS